MSEKYNDNSFFVIGSDSFSGSNFVDYLLKNNFNVTASSRSLDKKKVFLPYLWDNKSFDNLNYFQCDLNKNIDDLIEYIKKKKPAYIINFAAQGMVAESWLNPTHWYKTNVLSQVDLHEKLRRLNFIKKYVHVTTPEVYGSTDKGWLKENFEFSPSTPYAVSRAACDLHLMSFFKAYEFPVVFTRAANVYGPGQQLYRIIPRTILSGLCKKPMQLHGGGLSERSFVHINDVAKATLDIALKAESGSSWHISTKEKISIKNLTIKIFEKLNVNYTDFVEIGEERLGKDQSYLLDSSKLREKFNWVEDFNLDSGINDTINWVNKNLDELKNYSWDYQHKK
ncbi:GDP-mannose 4,6-dehydratase [Prochlorococcus sp. AH-716-A09]|nr:GDP-mannose 4,6-dehydratase [Prochlorococcus sp. AH-716-A09]